MTRNDDDDDVHYDPVTVEAIAWWLENELRYYPPFDGVHAYVKAKIAALRAGIWRLGAPPSKQPSRKPPAVLALLDMKRAKPITAADRAKVKKRLAEMKARVEEDLKPFRRVPRRRVAPR